MRKNFVIIPLVVFCDQAIKAFIRRAPQGYIFCSFPGLVEITHRTNTGAAFSLLSGNTLLVAFLSAFLLFGLGVLAIRKLHLTNAGYTALAFLLGGGIGNLVDRMVFSGVTDYIRILLFQFPVFNLADIAITLSVAMLLLLMLTGQLEEKTYGSGH